MKNTTIQVSQDAKSTLAILKYELGCKDYSETIERLNKIVKELLPSDQYKNETK